MDKLHFKTSQECKKFTTLIPHSKYNNFKTIGLSTAIIEKQNVYKYHNIIFIIKCYIIILLNIKLFIIPF